LEIVATLAQELSLEKWMFWPNHIIFFQAKIWRLFLHAFFLHTWTIVMPYI